MPSRNVLKVDVSDNYYQGHESPDWLNNERVLEMFSSPKAYLEFVNDYKDIRDVYEAIKHELAN